MLVIKWQRGLIIGLADSAKLVKI